MDAVSSWLAAYILLTLVGLRYLFRKYRKIRPHVEALDLDEVKVWLEEGAELWDVRSDREWETGTLKGVRTIPYGELPESLDPERKVICYCTSGIRSRAMAENLKKAGVKTTAFFKGGYHHIKEDDSFEVVIPS